MTQQTHPALADSPVLSSDQSGWQGIFFHHYDHPAYESPEHQWKQHIIGLIGRGGHPVESQHRLEGQVQHYYCKPGEMLFVPAGMRYASNWQQVGEFSLLGFSSRFFEQVVRESVHVKQVELIPHIGINDPLVQQVGLALKADVEAQHPTGRMFGEALATGLVIHLLRQYSVWRPQLAADDKGRLSESQLQRVFDYIHNHLDQDVALEDIANVLSLSQYHFCRLFKKQREWLPISI